MISRVMNKGNTDMTVEMSKASYPVITMQYQGIEINTLHGYADAHGDQLYAGGHHSINGG